MSEPSARALALFSDRYNIDATVIAGILGIALSRGGEFAELFFEHRESGSIAWEDQHVKAASRQAVAGELGFCRLEDARPALCGGQAGGSALAHALRAWPRTWRSTNLLS